MIVPGNFSKDHIALIINMSELIAEKLIDIESVQFSLINILH